MFIYKHIDFDWFDVPLYISIRLLSKFIRPEYACCDSNLCVNYNNAHSSRCFANIKTLRLPQPCSHLITTRYPYKQKIVWDLPSFTFKLLYSDCHIAALCTLNLQTLMNKIFQHWESLVKVNKKKNTARKYFTLIPWVRF